MGWDRNPADVVVLRKARVCARKHLEVKELKVRHGPPKNLLRLPVYGVGKVRHLARCYPVAIANRDGRRREQT